MSDLHAMCLGASVVVSSQNIDLNHVSAKMFDLCAMCLGAFVVSFRSIDFGLIDFEIVFDRLLG